MRLTYKFPLATSKAQITAFKKQLAVHQELYNLALVEKANQYEQTGKSDSEIDQIKKLVKLFKGKNCNVSSLQQTIRRLHKAYNAIYHKRGGKPRVNTNFTTVEYSTRSDGWQMGSTPDFRQKKVKKSMEENFLYLQGIDGVMRIEKHRNFGGEVKNLIVKLKDGKLWGCFGVEVFEKSSTLPTGKVGLDFGLKSFICTSAGEKIEHPLPYKNKLNKFRKLQKKLESVENEKLRKKKLKVLRKMHGKVKNQRTDFLHKLSCKIVNENSVIIVEDLNFKKLSRESPGSAISRKYGDIACGEFYRMLSYKAESAGRQFVKVNPAYTSMTCNNCAAINEELELKDRNWQCAKCGIELDRDINAAKNILTLGLQCLSKG